MGSQARVVIVGGGVMGISLLFHLAEEGWTDTILIEKGALTSGSTWHAAGQCPSFIADHTMAKVHAYGNDLYARLESMTGDRDGLARGRRDPLRHHRAGAGSLQARRRGRRDDRLPDAGHQPRGDPAPEPVRHDRGCAGRGLDARRRLRGSDRCVQRDGGCRAGRWAPPSSGTNRVTGIEPLRSGGFRVTTEQGDVTCEHVVNAAGCYADRVSAWLGVQTTFANMKHQYLVTEPIPEFVDRDGELPVMRDPYASAYYRQEQKSGLFGVYEGSDTREAWLDTGGPAWESSNELFEPEFEPIAPNLDGSWSGCRSSRASGIKRCGQRGHLPFRRRQSAGRACRRRARLLAGHRQQHRHRPGSGLWQVPRAVDGARLGRGQHGRPRPRRFGDYADQAYTSAKAIASTGTCTGSSHRARNARRAARRRARRCIRGSRPRAASSPRASAGSDRSGSRLDGREEEHSFRRNNVFEVVGGRVPRRARTGRRPGAARLRQL